MKTYFTPPGDILAIEKYIRSWLEREGRTASPVYIIGESYGGFRAGLLAGRISDLDVRGVVLVSPGLDVRDRGDLDFVTLLPSLAVAALAQNRITPRGRSVEEVFAEARAFAEGEYAAALQRGNRVTESERARIAERMAALIGVPKEKILAANLRFTETEFAGEAVPGKLVSLLDSRVSAPMPSPTAGRDNASSDPTLAMGASNIKTSPDIARYLREQVGLKINRPYVSLSLDVNFNFNWQPSSQSFEANRGWVSGKGLATLMKRRPKARLLVTGGYYDLATPLMRTFYDVDHLDVPADQVEQLALAAGHASYSTDDERRQMSAALHRFIADGAAR
jgi:carboxypeptidase C (cathepsin A)